MKREWKIPEDFIIGAASSAWQTEGWDGKKEGQDSYLDMWYKAEPHTWHDGVGPAGATDFYNRYAEDVAAMKEIGLTHYRTSVNWARFFLDHEECVVDEEYAQHISRVIDALLEAGVEPMLCLEHYEMPAVLMERYEGWSSKRVIELYMRYAEILFERYADRVKYWFTFNEPIVVQTRVYLDAIRWPHEQNTDKWMQWNVNKVVAHARAVQIYHELGYAGQIGVILNPEVTYPRSSSPGDVRAAHVYDLFFNRVFMDPMLKGEYPEELLQILAEEGVQFELTGEEQAVIRANRVDFAGLNFYYPKRVMAPRYVWNDANGFHPAKFYDNFSLPIYRKNKSRGWEIYPEIIYDMALRMRDEYGNIPWVISENGMGIEGEEHFMDSEGVVQDVYRIDFIAEHMAQALRARTEGVNLFGYMLWAFTDCVSPGNAFKNRYGLVRIDTDTKERSLKSSAYWYKQIIRDRVLEVDEREYK